MSSDFLQHWDTQFEHARSQSASVGAWCQNVIQQNRIQLIRSQLAILEGQGKLSQLIEKIRSFRTPVASLPQKSLHFLQWAAAYVDRVDAMYRARVQLLGKTMWLKLIRARTPGSTAKHSEAFSDENLLELSLRNNSLMEMEKALQEQLLVLEQEKLQLRYVYDDLCASEANRRASATMYANFGANYAEAVQNPVLSRLSELFKRVGEAVAPSSKKYSYLSELHSSIHNKTDKLMEQCKGLVLRDIYQRKDHDRRKNLRVYDAGLREIDELQKQLDIAKEIYGVDEARPRIVK